MKTFDSAAHLLQPRLSGLFLTAVFVLFAPLANAFDGYIDIENQTGYDIYYVYVSHESSTSWEEDMLEEQILENGETFRVTVEDYDSSIFDIKLVDEDGDSYSYLGVDIAENDIIAMPEHMDVETDEGIEGYLEVTNKTGHRIVHLYVSHDDAENWEEDVLNDSTLAAGDTVRVDISGYLTPIFDVHAEDTDGDTYTVYGIDISTDDLVLTKKHLDK